jgi:hypothetical protein
MTSPLALVRTFPLIVLLALPVPAAAHDWLGQWHSMRAEYQPAFKRARMIWQLDDAGLTVYVAEQNRLMNQQIHAEYHRSLPRSAGATPGNWSPAPPALPAPSAPAAR